jgi:hypothetical protein
MAGIMGDVINNRLGLQALAQGRQQIQEQEKQAVQQQEASDYLRKFYQSQKDGNPDYESLSEAVLRSPQLAQNALSAMKIDTDEKAKSAADFLIKANQFVDSPEDFMALGRSRVEEIMARGGDPSETLGMLEAYASGDVGKVKNGIRAGTAALTNRGYIDPSIYGQMSGAGAGLTPYQQAQIDIDKGKLNLDQAKLDFEKSKLVGGGGLSADTRQKINKDITPLVKGTEGIHSAARSLESLSLNSSPASQIAAVFKYMKALDPTSVVRSDEQGMIYGAEGQLKAIESKWNSMMGKGGLTKEGFQDLVDTAKVMANSEIDSKDSEIQRYLDVYEGTLPESFVKTVKGRVPKKFEIGGSGQGAMTTGINGDTAKKEARLKELRAKHGL